MPALDRKPGCRSKCTRLRLNICPPSDRRRFSTELLCLDLLRKFHALLRTELLCPSSLGPLLGRADIARLRLFVLRSTLRQSTITGHADLLLQKSNFASAFARLDEDKWG